MHRTGSNTWTLAVMLVCCAASGIAGGSDASDVARELLGASVAVQELCVTSAPGVSVATIDDAPTGERPPEDVPETQSEQGEESEEDSSDDSELEFAAPTSSRDAAAWCGLRGFAPSGDQNELESDPWRSRVERPPEPSRVG